MSVILSGLGNISAIKQCILIQNLTFSPLFYNSIPQQQQHYGSSYPQQTTPAHLRYPGVVDLASVGAGTGNDHLRPEQERGPVQTVVVWRGGGRGAITCHRSIHAHLQTHIHAHSYTVIHTADHCVNANRNRHSHLYYLDNPLPSPPSPMVPVAGSNLYGIASK